MAYMARKFGVRIVYWSATRGEGGQNRIGPDKEEALGVYRTWESLAARAVDGGEALFGPFYDFGFSKSGEETLAKWGGRRGVVREIVRAIRKVQPLIVISRWTGQPSDGHGHHQAVGATVSEAFEAAGDPNQFSELQTQGLVAWQPRKLYYSTGGDWQPGEAGGVWGALRPELERGGLVRINTGEFDPISNRTYQEQAWIGFYSHKTQAMGFVPNKGPFYYYFSLSKSLVPVPDKETWFYEGLDSSLTGLVRGSLADEDLNNDARQAFDMYLERKLNDFEEVVTQCLGLNLECLAEYARITPGQQFRATARLWNHRDIAIEGVKFTLRVPDGWQIEPVDREGIGEGEAVYDITTSESAELTCPYWLDKPRESYHYNWPLGERPGQPFDPPLVELECEVALGLHQITLREPAIFREAFSGGFRELPLAVLPPISLHPKIKTEFLQVRPSKQHLELHVVARSNMEWTGIEGSLKLEIPPGWQVEPSEVHLTLGQAGDSRTVRFSVVIPENTSAGHYPLRYLVKCGGRDYGVVLNPVRMAAPGLPRLPDEATCVKEQLITSPAVGNVHLIDARFVTGLRYGYIKGVDEDLLKALTHFDLDFHLITD
ncbi:MAG: PIG-L family deacetylase, partial [Anaerolineae bacterium]